MVPAWRVGLAVGHGQHHGGLLQGPDQPQQGGVRGVGRALGGESGQRWLWGVSAVGACATDLSGPFHPAGMGPGGAKRSGDGLVWRPRSGRIAPVGALGTDPHRWWGSVQAWYARMLQLLGQYHARRDEAWTLARTLEREMGSL